MPPEFDGIVRDFVGDEGIYQVLANVTDFNATCAPEDTATIGTVALAATLGRLKASAVSLCRQCNHAMQSSP